MKGYSFRLFQMLDSCGHHGSANNTSITALQSTQSPRLALGEPWALDEIGIYSHCYFSRTIFLVEMKSLEEILYRYTPLLRDSPRLFLAFQTTRCVPAWRS